MIYPDDIVKQKIDENECMEWVITQYQNDAHHALAYALKVFPDKVSVEIIERHLLLEKPQTFNEIGKALHLTERQVSYRYHRSLPRLRCIAEAYLQKSR